ncbi:OmpA family protein [Aristophania vespae]|uniref:OmpA family protein n=1 Tax=Aristophania vespae TaxID=2697033 RepID=A0A6P1NKD9_9PROT|nr:OmpA family protein [Aristophania vespae]QHI95320.1 OmpA family protein [Aristophania vespae]QHI95321.1 OmpA family protein [Aristophania vespae]UMM64577.1 Outer membrane protein [Aristophania vespae]UMM64578.1 Outer membrane protein [Aristophania vespae]
MRIRTALLAVTSMVAAPSLALASTITGPYIDLGAGYNLTQHQRMTTPATGNTGRQHQLDGYTGFLSAGWGFGNGLRLEVEGVYAQSYNKIFGGKNGSPRGYTRGSNQGYGGLINVLYDIDLAQFGIDVPVTPFVGIGAGYMWEKYRLHHDVPGGQNSMSRTGGGFAAQAIVGAAYDIPGVPGLAVTTQYRFLTQTGSESGVNIGTYKDIKGNKVKTGTRYQHQFILGLRYAFDNAPPPPPPPAHVVVPPQRTPARTYLVFFDWDKANLTPRAREIVAQAAQASTHVQTTRIEVNGYTDNSAAHPGPRGQKYNMGLSLRRANSVKAELVRDGVPATAINIHGYGEAHPLVATAPNTREPQNRRVEIILK